MVSAQVIASTPALSATLSPIGNSGNSYPSHNANISSPQPQSPTSTGSAVGHGTGDVQEFVVKKLSLLSDKACAKLKAAFDVFINAQPEGSINTKGIIFRFISC